MDQHVRLVLHGYGDFGTVARVVMRLHSMHCPVTEFHVVQSAICIHLAASSNGARAARVLNRLVDVEVVSVDAAGCVGQENGDKPWLRTTYLAWSTPSPERCPEPAA